MFHTIDGLALIVRKFRIIHSINGTHEEDKSVAERYLQNKKREDSYSLNLHIREYFQNKEE